MSRRFAFLPLALSLFLAALAGPALQRASAVISSEIVQQRDLRTELYQELGQYNSISGPVLMVPVIGAASPSILAASEVKIFPALLDVDIEQTSVDEARGNQQITVKTSKVIFTARFEQADDLEVVLDGERLDWDQAYFRMPIPFPVSLQSDPVLIVDGLPTPFLRTRENFDRISLNSGTTGFPSEDVVLSMALTTAGSVTDIYPTGGITNVIIKTDDLGVRFNSVRPHRSNFFWLGRTLEWSLDGLAENGRAEREGFDIPFTEGFLGMAFKEPDGTGPVTIYSDRNRATHTNYSTLIRLVPVAFAAAALILCATGTPGYGKQLGLLFNFFFTYVFAFYIAQFVGPQAGWKLGAVVMAITTMTLIYTRGWITLILMTIICTGLWYFLWDVLYSPQLPNGTPLSYVARFLAQPILLGLCVLALVAAGIQSVLGPKARQDDKAIAEFLAARKKGNRLK